MSGRTAARRRRRRWPWFLLCIALIVVLVFYGGGGLYFSNVLDERGLDAVARRADTATLEPDVEVLEVDTSAEGDTDLVLRATTATPAELTRDSVVGLRWDGGYGRLDAVTGAEADADDVVRRPLQLMSGDLPEPGAPAQLDVRAYPSDPMEAELGLRAVTVPGPLGDYPAWLGTPFGDATSSTWAIVVHGNSLSPADGLRMVPILTDAGYPTLVASYRNDPGAPSDPSGKLRYGLTEWRDLEAMVRYTLGEGAEGVVLDGYSMGAGIVMAFLQRSELAGQVRAVIMDAPMLDFSATVDDNASREEIAPGVPLPSSLTAVAKRLASWQFGVDWPALDYLADTRPYDPFPFLVFHGTADDTVPVAISRELKSLLPDQVQLEECEGAGHIECWNLDPEAYAGTVNVFLQATAGA